MKLIVACLAAVIVVALTAAQDIRRAAALRQVAVEFRAKAENHAAVVEPAILDEIRRAGGRPNYIVLGDSITREAPLRPVCGRTPINAGVGGAFVATFHGRAPHLVRLAKPDLVVVALGINDSFVADLDEFRRDLIGLLDSLPDLPVVLMGIQPIEPSKWLGAEHPDPARIARFNRALRKTASQRGMPFIGPAATVETTDGVHLTKDAYEGWVRALEQELLAALRC